MKKSVITFFLLNLLLLVAFSYYIVAEFNDFMIFVPFLGSLISLLSLYFLIIQPTKKVIKSVYGISILTRFTPAFSTREWEIFYFSLLRAFLTRNGIIKKMAYDDLKEVLAEKAENQAKNYTPLLNTGIILALFIPVWSAAITRLFRSINDLNTGITIVILFLFIILLVSTIVVNIKYFVKEFSFFSKEQSRIYSLKNSLNMISFEISLAEIEPSPKSYEFEKNIIDKVIADYTKKYSKDTNLLNDLTAEKINIEGLTRNWFKYINSKLNFL
ncbi:hypothetical protein [Paenisporosarcina sp. NPDC076898]|uniref:hypothetical protein n=1 Tax=unclassified Paenisporosarcina TaxID=2642018 RepID=UPI003D0745F4